MQVQPTFMVVDRIKKNRAPPGHRARAEVAVVVAVRDFRTVWTSISSVDVVGTGSYAGRSVVAVRVGAHDYVVGDGDHAQLVANLVRLLQVIATDGNTQWPTIPGIGALSAGVKNGCAIWVMPNGAEFCEIGHIFAEST